MLKKKLDDIRRLLKRREAQRHQLPTRPKRLSGADAQKTHSSRAAIRSADASNRETNTGEAVTAMRILQQQHMRQRRMVSKNVSHEHGGSSLFLPALLRHDIDEANLAHGPGRQRPFFFTHEKNDGRSQYQSQTLS